MDESIGDILCQAINGKKKIVFEYHKPGEPLGERFGNPHALFITTKDNPCAEIWQTGGDISPTDKRDFPHWSMFLLEFIKNIKILEETFEITAGDKPYKPDSPRYIKVICKI